MTRLIVMISLFLFAINTSFAVKNIDASFNELYKKATQQNDAEAQFYLGRMYYNGQGVKKDFTKAKEWFEKATEQHNMTAQAFLGGMYWNGDGVDKNRQKGKELIEESALSGDPMGQFNFGVLYEEADPQKTYKGI